MTDQDPITMTTTSDFPPLINHIKKFVLLANELFASNEHSGFYVESIQDGLVFFFTNFETIEKYYPQIEHLNLIPKNPSLFVSPDHFPRSGIKVFHKPDNCVCEDLLPIFEKHYHSIHPEITVNINETGDIEVFFPVFEAIENYGLFNRQFFMAGLEN
jgi:hypothetical protein